MSYAKAHKRMLIIFVGYCSSYWIDKRVDRFVQEGEFGRDGNIESRKSEEIL